MQFEEIFTYEVLEQYRQQISEDEEDEKQSMLDEITTAPPMHK